MTARDITYIPSASIDENTLSLLEEGDYIGIYTDLAGLDVTHTGIFIRGENGPVLRNASSLSSNMQVVDSPSWSMCRTSRGSWSIGPRPRGRAPRAGLTVACTGAPGA